MSTKSSSSEIKENHIAVLGREFGGIYNSLYNEIIWLYRKWDEYNELFGKNESRVALLNKSAPWFFFIVQKVFWNDILLGIARMTDNPIVARKRTTTLNAIPDFIEDPKFKKEVKAYLSRLMKDVKFCRDWRNRVIAHKDYNLVVLESAKPLEPASRSKIDNAFESIFTLMNIIQSKYFGSTTMFKDIEKSHGAVSLISLIDGGLSARKEKGSTLERSDSSNKRFKEK